MIKKLLLIFSFIVLTTIAFSGTTYAAQEGETIVITEELTKLINLYKEGVITEEEFSKAKSILLNPDSDISKKKKIDKKKLTAVERRDLEELEKEELKAAKKAERERKLDEEAEIERACKEDPQSKECRSVKGLLKKLKIISSATSKKEKKERELEKQASLEEQKRIKAEKAAAKRAEVAAKKAEKKRLKAERKKACSEDPESKACKEGKRKKFLIF